MPLKTAVSVPAAKSPAMVAKPPAGVFEHHATEAPLHALDAAAFRRRRAALAAAAESLPPSTGLRQRFSLSTLGAWAAETLPDNPADERRVGLERLAALLDAEVARLGARSAQVREQDYALKAVLRLHEQLLAGDALNWPLVEALAATVRGAQQEAAGPALDLTPRDDRATEFARTRLNLARIDHFLAATAPVAAEFAAALLLDAPLLVHAASGHRAGLLERDAHPAAAAKMLAGAGGFAAELLAAVRAHHEPPASATPTENGLLTRRFGVATAYADALTETADPRAALQRTLRQAAAGALDEAFALRLLEVSFHPTGTFVELATGEHAEVVATQRLDGSAALASLPIVRIRRRADGVPQAGVVVWNLAQRPAARIVRGLSPVEAACCQDE